MKKGVLLTAALVMAVSVPASAKTTVTVDYVDDVVTVKSTELKARAYAYKLKTVYAVGKTRLYNNPRKGSKYTYVVPKGEYLTRIAKGKKYSIIRYGDKKRRYYFAKNTQLTTKKPVTKAKYSASYFRRAGVIKWDGWRWTWYSQRVLPGGGLKIPGRHVDEHGYICDGKDRICLASSTLKKGTVVATPFGKKGCVYDSGCAAGTLDVYVDRLHD